MLFILAFFVVYTDFSAVLCKGHNKGGQQHETNKLLATYFQKL